MTFIQRISLFFENADGRQIALIVIVVFMLTSCIITYGVLQEIANRRVFRDACYHNAIGYFCIDEAGTSFPVTLTPQN